MTVALGVGVEELWEQLSRVGSTAAGFSPVGADTCDLERLVRRLSTTISQLTGLRARLATELTARQAWRTSGAASPAAYLAEQANVPRGQAAAEIKLGEAMAKSDTLAGAVGSGQLGMSQASAVADVACRPEFERAIDGLVDDVASQSPRDARRTVDRFKARHDPAGDQRDAEALFARRSLRLGSRGDRMGTGEWLLDPESQAVVRSTIEHLARQDRLDGTLRTAEQRAADALVALCKAYNAGQVGGGREVPKVLVLVDYDTVVGRAHERGVMATGDTMTAEAVRRICCDAELHRLVTRGPSCPLDLGAATRVISDSQYLALLARDRGCRFPGCERPPSWCEGHHIVPWQQRQRTNLDDVVLLCRYHHHLVHEGSWRLEGTARNLRVLRPDGSVHHADRPDAWGAPPTGASGAASPNESHQGVPHARGTLFDDVEGGPFADPPGDPPWPPV
jgi:hypothetical protein